MTNKSQPFISFLVLAYNQREFIREAVEGAFAQQCVPMEIILSDDCSTDETFAIMQEMAKAYSGPHEIVVRHNESNLGLINHINSVFQIARGEWIVVAAGDDISMPNRVEQIVRVIEEYPDINMVSSALIAMDDQGNRKSESCVFQTEDGVEPSKVFITGMTELINDKAPRVHGATLAYSRKLIEAFSPMPGNAVYEDAIFRFRSALLGTKAHINQPLVLYRTHPGQTTNIYSQFGRKLYYKKKKLAIGGLVTVRQLLVDLTSSAGFDVSLYQSLERFLREELEYRRLRYRLIVWLWPLRLLYFFLALMLSEKKVKSLKKNDIILTIFPVILVSALSCLFRIGAKLKSC